MRLGAAAACFFDFFTAASAADFAASTWAASLGWRCRELLHDSERDDSEKFCRARRRDEVERRWASLAAARAASLASRLLWLLLLRLGRLLLLLLLFDDADDWDDDDDDDDEEEEEDEDESEDDSDDDESLLPENEISKLEA